MADGDGGRHADTGAGTRSPLATPTVSPGRGVKSMPSQDAVVVAMNECVDERTVEPTMEVA